MNDKNIDFDWNIVKELSVMNITLATFIPS